MKLSLLIFLICISINQLFGQSIPLYQFDANLQPRWSSPENRGGQKGQGGKENNGAKGHAFDLIQPGSSAVLMQVQGQGIINRIWVTVSDRSPQMLRSLKLEMFWDNETKPAVSVPFGDFFSVSLGKTTSFENTFFANPEGRSFLCYIPMPFRRAAKIVVTNESNKPLKHIFFDVDYQLVKQWNNDYLYFHAYWHRDSATTLTKDFELLPAVNGKGRFLGVNAGVQANPIYGKSWWGEGEVKVFLDGDKEHATLVGTGTEDYIATGWGQGKFIQQYTGSTIAIDSLLQWSFYRYHIPDPIFFSANCRVTLQQIGGEMKKEVARMQSAGIPLIPVTVDNAGKLTQLYKKDSIVSLGDASIPDGWVNYYRSDDLCATAYFYLDKPSSNLPALAGVPMRVAGLR